MLTVIMDLQNLQEISSDSLNLVTVECTVVTGFEQQALEECVEKFGPDLHICKKRGRIYFNIDCSKVPQVVKTLHSVDHVSIIVHYFKETQLFGNKEADLEIFRRCVDGIKWNKCLNIWAQVTKNKGLLFPTKSDYILATRKFHKPKNVMNDTEEDNIVEDRSNVEDIPDIIKYRVTCHRVGTHSFSSQEAACHFGGALQDLYHWIVNLDNYDLEVLLNVLNKEVTVQLAITENSLHRRNITHFGSTTLRATVSYNMLRLANVVNGEFVIDPLCGSGSIPIEGSLAFPTAFHICGDIEEKCVRLTHDNLDVLNMTNQGGNLYMEIFQWDACSLPLRNNSVDAVVTDLPFGKRVGSRYKNKTLYVNVIGELSRVVKPVVGRGVFLTTDRRSFSMMMRKCSQYWKQEKTLKINMGGLKGFVYLLRRSRIPF